MGGELSKHQGVLFDWWLFSKYFYRRIFAVVIMDLPRFASYMYLLDLSITKNLWSFYLFSRGWVSLVTRGCSCVLGGCTEETLILHPWLPSLFTDNHETSSFSEAIDFSIVHRLIIFTVQKPKSPQSCKKVLVGCVTKNSMLYSKSPLNCFAD